MSFSPFQRWILAAATLWGIPACLFWMGIGFSLDVSFRWKIDDCLKLLDRQLSGISGNAEGALKTRLNSGFEELSAAPVGSPEFVMAATNFEKSFPSGLMRVFLFDRNGKLMVSDRGDSQEYIQKFFDFIRRPWTEHFPMNPDYFKGLEVFFPNPYQVVGRIRDCQGDIYPLGSRSRESRFNVWGFFRWNSNAGENRIGGMVVLLFFRFLQTEFLLRESLKLSDSADLLAGCFSGDETIAIPRGFSHSRFSRLYLHYRSASSRRVVFEEFLVGGQPFREDSLILALIPIPRFPTGFLIWLFSGYGILSFFFMRKLYRVVVFREPLGFSLGPKLAFIFFLGIAFPVMTAASLGLLYLEEKKEELTVENRKEAFSRLDQIDSQFEKYLMQRQLFYQKLGMDFRANRADIKAIRGILKKAQEEFFLEDFYVISSQSEIIFAEQATKDSDFTRLLSLSKSERLKYFYALMSLNRGPTKIDEIDCLLDRIPLEKIEKRMEPDTSDRVFKFISKLADDSIGYSNLQQGLEIPRQQRNSGLLLDTFLEEEGQVAFKYLKLYLGQLLKANRFTGRGYVYTDVLKNSKGGGEYFLLIHHSMLTAQYAYMENCFSENLRRTPENEIRAIGYETPFAPNFPLVAGDPFRIVHERLDQSGAPKLVMRMVIDGLEVEIVAQKGENLDGFDLLHVTPQSTIVARLRLFQSRVLTLLGGTALFGFILGGILLRKFLRPIQSLVKGISAVGEKQFAHRVQVHSRDELGQLCVSLNKTIEHMSEMEMASALQSRLFPENFLKAGNFEISARNLMTQSIGGDYFDFFPLPDNRVVVIIGDVSGHGVSAALVTAMAKAGFTILCPLFFNNPAMIMEKINKQFISILKKKKMMTCFMGILDPEKETLVAVNAGQNSPVLVNFDGGVKYLELVSNPLGIFKMFSSASTEISLADKWLILYSDGLVEAINESQEPFGYDAFLSLAGKTIKLSPADAPEAIFKGVRKHTDPVPWQDDATLVVIGKR